MSDPGVSARDFGRIEAEVANLRSELANSQARAEKEMNRLQTDVGALTSRVSELIALANQGRGAWWAGLTFASLISAAATWFISIFTNR
jgi:hypothetical protein